MARQKKSGCSNSMARHAPSQAALSSVCYLLSNSYTYIQKSISSLRRLRGPNIHLHRNRQSNLLTATTTYHHHRQTQLGAAESSHRHLPCLDTERERSRGRRSKEAALWERTGVKPTSHDTKALWKMFLTRCHRHGDVGITRQLQASQSWVRHSTPTNLGTVELHHHDSQHSKGAHIMYILFVESHLSYSTLTLNLCTRVCKFSQTQEWAGRHSHKCNVGLHTVCTCYLSLPPPTPTSVCFSVFLSLMF